MASAEEETSKLSQAINQLLETLSTPDEDIAATGSDGNHGRKRHNTYTCEYILANALGHIVSPTGPLERTYAYVNITEQHVISMEKMLKEQLEKMNETLSATYGMIKILTDNSSEIKSTLQDFYNKYLEDHITVKGPEN